MTVGDGDRRATIDDGCCTETATEDVVGYDATRYGHRGSTRIGSILTAAIDIADGATVDDDSDCLLRSTVHVVTAEHVLSCTALRGDSDSTIDIGGNICVAFT